MTARPTRPGARDSNSAGVAFADYLEAKFALDERSLNAEVRRVCIERLAARRGGLRWLDVGTGTGAMVRRLLERLPSLSLEITALDRDAGVLDVASSTIRAQLERLGHRTRADRTSIEAESPSRRARVDFRCCALFDFEPVRRAPCDLITAHAFMDVVPIAPALRRFSEWLTPGGLLYTTLNYDGDTVLFPVYGDERFESRILDQYDASMESRRVQGESTGGARSGRRLHSLLSGTGFDVIAYGSSDWNITPREGTYRDQDADVLRALLACIHAEAERHPEIDRYTLDMWYSHRSAQLVSAELGMIVHQLDILAVCRKDLTALT
jgi:SAM-dependent methyltransferase